MNRYMLDGLLADMRAGKRVLYLGPDLAEARELLDRLTPRLLPEERARRANGKERIESRSTGGWVRLSSVRSLIRGMAVDVVVMAADPTERQMEEIAVLACCSELIGP